MLRIETSGLHIKLDDKLHRYVSKKIGGLEKYLTKPARTSAHAEVKLIEKKARDKNQCTCEVILHLPIENITVRETTINMYAAIDIAEAKLKHGLRKYKDIHGSPRLHRRIINRLRRRPS